MFALFIGGGDDEALTEAAFSVRGLEALAGGGEKGIDIGLLERIRRVMELALNGPIIATAALPCHQADTNVRTLAMRPFRPQPYLGETVLILRVYREVTFHQALESGAFIVAGARGRSQFMKQVAESCLVHRYHPVRA